MSRRVSLFVTCLGDTLFPQAARATVELLERLGCEVDFPEAQTCCGQLHLNGGYPDEARKLAQSFVETFAGADAIVCPSSSCAATVRNAYPGLIDDDGRLAALRPKVFELSEYLTDELGLTDVGARFAHKVAYHPTCSSLRGLKVGDRALRLLRAVRDIELVELENAEVCCGFGGTFAVKNAAVSSEMLADKMAAVTASGAEVCTALDSSCLMHIGGGLSRNKAGARTMHLAEILASTGGAQ